MESDQAFLSFMGCGVFMFVCDFFVLFLWGGGVVLVWFLGFLIFFVVVVLPRVFFSFFCYHCNSPQSCCNVALMTLVK